MARVARVGIGKMSTRESADDYDHVVAILSDRWRVIDSMESKPYRQWIVQYNSSITNARWVGRQYLQTRSILLRNIKEVCGVVNDNELTKVQSLPNSTGELP